MSNRRDAFSEFDDGAGLEDFVEQTDRESQEPPKEEMIPKSRLDEVVADRNALRSEREMMIRSMLDRSNQQAMPAPSQPELPPGVDEEVATAVKPLLDHTLAIERQRIIAEANQAVEAKYGRVLRESERAANLTEMDRRVPGFRQYFPKIREEWGRLSPQEKAEYGVNAAAMEGFARRVIGSGPPPSGLDGMAYSESTRPQMGPGKTDMTADDVWNMSQEEFERRFGQSQM